MSGGGYGFIPWVRSGLASLATTAPSQNFVSLQVGLTVNTTAAPAVTVRLFGPGQVTGLDPRAIVRMEPLPNSTNFETNYFAGPVEFADTRLSLAVLATVPSGAALMPWLCLVVVAVQPGVTLTQRPNALPVLQFAWPANPVVELPNLKRDHDVGARADPQAHLLPMTMLYAQLSQMPAAIRSHASSVPAASDPIRAISHV